MTKHFHPNTWPTKSASQLAFKVRKERFREAQQSTVRPRLSGLFDHLDFSLCDFSTICKLKTVNSKNNHHDCYLNRVWWFIQFIVISRNYTFFSIIRTYLLRSHQLWILKVRMHYEIRLRWFECVNSSRQMTDIRWEERMEINKNSYRGHSLLLQQESTHAHFDFKVFSRLLLVHFERGP